MYADDTKISDSLVDQYHDMARRVGNRNAFVNKKQPIPNKNFEKINQIKTPTLIMWGDGDNWIPIENAYSFQKNLPNDTLIIYKNLGHVPMEENPTLTVIDANNFFIN